MVKSEWITSGDANKIALPLQNHDGDDGDSNSSVCDRKHTTKNNGESRFLYKLDVIDIVIIVVFFFYYFLSTAVANV